MVSLPSEAHHIIDTLKSHGFEAYVVGGSVRDLILGKATKNWDFTTSATPEQILETFPDSFYDNQFGTVGLKIYEKQEDESTTNTIIKDIFEVTTFRSEAGYSDHRHPDQITWGKTLEEDLSRRDFTINAIAFDGNTLIDPYSGQKDLENKVIRAVGEPDRRFSEDALRIMRAIRIASQLGFTIDEPTRLAIIHHAETLTKISVERIRDELLKLLASPFAADGILLMKNTGILHVILPELDESFTIGQKSPKRHHIYDVGMHSVMAVKHCPSNDPVVRFATLLHDIGKPRVYKQDETGLITFYNHEVVGAKIARNIAQRLRMSKKQIHKIVTLVRWHQFTVDERQTDNALRRFIRHVSPEYLQDMLALRIGDRLGGGARETSWRLELFKKRLEEVQKQPFGVSDLNVDGHDVMRIFDTKPGRIIGDVLDALFQEVEDAGLPNDREALLKRLEEMKQDNSFAIRKT